jgi:hypothetical protein
MLRKIITWAIALFVIFYVATQPSGAADIVHHACNGLREAGQSLGAFVESL